MPLLEDYLCLPLWYLCLHLLARNYSQKSDIHKLKSIKHKITLWFGKKKILCTKKKSGIRYLGIIPIHQRSSSKERLVWLKKHKEPTLKSLKSQVQVWTWTKCDEEEEIFEVRQKKDFSQGVISREWKNLEGYHLMQFFMFSKRWTLSRKKCFSTSVPDRTRKAWYKFGVAGIRFLTNTSSGKYTQRTPFGFNTNFKTSIYTVNILV